MTAPSPHLPKAFIGVAPHSFEMGEQRKSKIQRGVETLEAADPRVMEGVHHLAEDIELELVGGSVADAHGFRALVTAEPWHLALGQPALARDPVHDLELRGASRRGAQQPVAPSLRLVVVSPIHEREQC